MSTPLESELAAETRAWMAKAAEDLHAARVLLASDPALPETALFHCQQAAEKALKAFLTWHGVAFRKTHNLEEIGEQCLAVDDSLRDVVDQATPLTAYAWMFRYPGGPEAADEEDTARGLLVAERTLEAVASRIPPQARR